MSASELIAIGTTVANSADLLVGAPVTVGLKGYSNTAQVYIYLKDDAASYNLVGQLTSGSPAVVISGPGTYRFTRTAAGACGVFSA